MITQVKKGMPSTVDTLTGSPIQFSETNDYVKLNFTMFVVEFYKGTKGYNKIYNKTGDVLVYDDRVVLEYLFKAPDTWKQRGTPISVSWVKINDYHYEVIRHYTDYLGTTYNITYTVKSDSPMKITVNLKSGQNDTYRIAWRPSGITKTVYAEKNHRVVFGNENVDYDWISFDWNDVYQKFGNITETSYENVANGKKPIWSYTLIGIQNIMSLLKQILPLLIVKREHAEIMLRYCDLRKQRWHKRFTQEEFDLANRLRQLNGHKSNIVKPNPQPKKKHAPWNKGKLGVYSKEALKKMSLANKGKHLSPATEFKKGQIPWNKR